MPPIDPALGLQPVIVPGVEPRTEDPDDQKSLCWGPLPEKDLILGRRKAVLGIWLRWEGPRERTPVRVWIHYDVLGCETLAPLTRARRRLLQPLWLWLQQVRHHGLRREVLLELEAGANRELLLADLRDFHLYGDKPGLRPEPEDTSPLGKRFPVVISHGLLWDSPHLRLSGITSPLFFNAIRGHKLARKLRDRVKWYSFEYPSWRHPRWAGETLAAEVRSLLDREQASSQTVLVAHSMGGLVQRYAMNTGDFAGLVRASLSAGSPHRGTLINSLAASTADLRPLMTPGDLVLLRQGFGNLMPDCPGFRGIFYDNADGAFDRAGFGQFELQSNPELARFNAEDPHLDKVVCFAGDCPRLGLWLVNPKERIRRVQERYFPGFANADPFVPLQSASLAGTTARSEVRAGADHLGWVMAPWQVELLVREIERQIA
jgi:pimeloyl-ACP methyl ester carboxylesterase